MKKHSKIIAVVVMLAMMLTSVMSMSVFAADPDGSIIINAPSSGTFGGQTFNAYKIFDYAVNATTGADEYTVNAAFEDFTYVDVAFDPDGIDKDNLVAYVQSLISNSAKMNALAAKLWEYIEDEPVAYAGTTGALAVDADTAEIDELEYGYYLVYGSIANEDDGTTVVAACALNTVKPDVEITAKADVPTIGKKIWDHNQPDADDSKVGDKDEAGGWVESTDLHIGDKAYYKLTSNVPNMAGYEVYTYNVYDKMSDGLSFNDDIEIWIGATKLVKDTHYTVKTGVDAIAIDKDDNVENNTFKIEFTNFLQWAAQKGDPIVITYSATVNENAVIGAPGEDNEVFLEFSNNPYDNDSKDKTPDEKTKVYTFDLEFFKHAEDGDGDPFGLAGAKFVLNEIATGDAVKLVKITTGIDPTIDPVTKKVTDFGTADVYRHATEEDNAKNEDADPSNDVEIITTIITPNSGLVKIEGLDAGKYELEETDAPANYNKLPEALKVEIVHNGEGAYDIYWKGYKDDGGIILTSDTLDILNVAGITLPSTGGIGRTIFILVGATMIGLGLVSLVVFRKKIFGSK